MREGRVEITNERGFHARAASRFVHEASVYASDIKLSKGPIEVDGKSILGILLLQAGKGSVVTLRVDGEDEGAAFENLSELIANRFGEKN